MVRSWAISIVIGMICVSRSDSFICSDWSYLETLCGSSSTSMEIYDCCLSEMENARESAFFVAEEELLLSRGKRHRGLCMNVTNINIMRWANKSKGRGVPVMSKGSKGYSWVRCFLTSNYRQQMQVKGTKGNRVRIILLKEAPPPAGLYNHHRTRPSLSAPFEQPMAKPKVNCSSIAYLSSILQDEHMQQERTTLLPPQTPVKRHYLQQAVDDEDATIEKLDNYRWSGKKSNRYLSSLLETTQERESTAVHAKTEGIEKLLRRRKILPIDKITQRRKNITFSLKNKRELNQDFHEFVQQRTATAAREEPQHPIGERESMAFPHKPDMHKRVCSLRGEKEKRKSRGVMHHLQLMEPNLPLPPNFLKKNTSIDSREPGYAIAFKRLSSDIPELNSFEWSRLDQNPYKLARQPQRA